MSAVAALSPKNKCSDLAILGGTPLFKTPRPIGQLAVPDRQQFFDYAKEIYAGRRLTNNGPLVRKLEEKLAELHKVEHCVSVANASFGLILLMESLARGRQGEVIMPAFTYPGLPHLAQWAGQRPRFCDVDVTTHTPAVSSVEEALSQQTTSILAVHQVNSPCHIRELEALAASKEVPLIFDSVHGIHCTYDGLPIGRFGRAEVFSLHATKLLNGFEGGYVTTNDAALADVLRKKRNFGINSEGAVEMLGFNAKLNEIHAACALASLEIQPELIERNRHRVISYRESFASVPGITWVEYRDKTERMNYEFALLVVPEGWPLSRDVIVQILRRENALARAYYSPPLHLSPHCPPDLVPPRLPVTEKLAQSIIQMPVGEKVSDRDVAALAQLFAFLHRHAGEIAAEMSARGVRA